MERTPILLVEDNSSDALLIQQAFRKARIRNPLEVVSTATAALEFLRKGENSRPVFILLDLYLPDLSGYEVLRCLKEDHASSAIPVVVVTGSEHPKEKEISLRLGATAFFVKSLTFSDVIDLVNQVGGQWLLESRVENPPHSC